jgi:hypothetical protein
MRGLIRRAVVAAGVSVVLLGPAAGVARASGTVALGWSPQTSGSYSYGTVSVSQTPKPSQTFILKNAGTSATAALKTTLTGSAAFTKTADTCAGTSLGPGKSCSVTVRYAPAAPGETDTATLTASSNKPAATASLTLEGAAAQASPTIATSASGGGTAGASTVTDTATLTGGNNPTGSVTFKLYGPSAAAACTGTAVFTDTEKVSGGAATSAPYTPTQAGTYWWTAGYGGDSANTTAATKCGDESVTISQAAPAIATSPSAGGTVGTAVTDTATLTGGDNPSGSITFRLYGPSAAANCSGAAVDTETVTVNGNGTYTTPAGAKPADAGTYWWAASYGGDSNNTTAASSCDKESVTISQAAPAIATSPSAGGTVGAAVTDTATLTGGDNPTGSITFKLYGPSAAAACTGTAVFTDTEKVSGGAGTSAPYTPTQAGTYWWTASYSGDSNNTSAASSCDKEPVTLSPASPALGTSPNVNGDGTIGSTTVTDTATLSDAFNPTGTIMFTLYGPSRAFNCSSTLQVVTDTEKVSGGAATSSPYTPTQAGTYWWAASYSGDPGNNPASSVCGAESVTINPASPALTTTPEPASATVGTVVKDTATLAGGYNPTGFISFDFFGPFAPGATPDCSGPQAAAENVTVNGNGSYTTTLGQAPTQPGVYYWVASYSGDTNNNAPFTGCGDEPVVISLASPAITTSPSAGGPPGTALTDTATLTGGSAPGGSIEFQLYGPSATADCTGTAVFTDTETVSGSGATSAPFTPSQPGTYHWTASYSGDPGNNPATTNCGAESVTITKASPTLSTSPSLGGPAGTTAVTDTATLTGGSAPGGSIEFQLYGPSATADCTGTAVFTDTESVSGSGATSAPFTPPQPGIYHWTASYSGDPGNNPAATNCGDESVTITKASPALATSPSPGVPPGMAVTDTATLTGGSSPGGSVEFKLYGPSATADCTTAPVLDKTVAVTGNGSYLSPPFTATTAGSYWWTASYSGDPGNNPATTSCGDESVTIGPHLYWTDLGDGTVKEANLDGTGVTTLVSHQSSPSGVAVDSSHIYWANNGNGTIMEANLDGTGVTTLVSGQSNAVGLAVDSSHIYWTTRPGTTIMEANLDGTGVTTFVSGQNNPYGVAVDSSHIYWSNINDGTIKEANLSGTIFTTFATGQSQPRGVAVDSSHIYWANNGNGTIMEINTSQPGTGGTLITIDPGASGVAVDSSHIYWSNINDGTIKEASLGIPAATLLVTGQKSPSAMAVGP